MRMAQIAALVAAAHIVDGSVGPLQLHLEGSHEGIFRHHRHAVTRAGDVDANGEFVGDAGTSLLAVDPKRIMAIAWRRRIDAHIITASRPLCTTALGISNLPVPLPGLTGQYPRSVLTGSPPPTRGGDEGR